MVDVQQGEDIATQGEEAQEITLENVADVFGFPLEEVYKAGIKYYKGMLISQRVHISCYYSSSRKSNFCIRRVPIYDADCLQEVSCNRFERWFLIC